MSTAEEESGPIYSRLFIVGDKDVTDDRYREEFSKFGRVQSVRAVRDRKTGESKGIQNKKLNDGSPPNL